MGDSQLGGANTFCFPTASLCLIPPAKHLVQTANRKLSCVCWNLDASA